MVRMRATGRLEKAPSDSGAKHTTSQRPTDGDVAPIETEGSAGAVRISPGSGPNDGDRFSNTTTS